MTADPSPELAQELTIRIAKVAGVSGVFPRRGSAPPLLRRVLPSPLGASALIDVDDDGRSVTVTARLATSRGTPTPTVVQGVRAAVLSVIGDRPCALDIEIATID